MRSEVPTRLAAGLDSAANAVLRRAVECDNGVPGVVAAVTDRQATVYAGAAGRRDLDHAQPMTLDTVMSIYSCTKAITGTVVMQLVEARTIGLDDPAQQYVPEIADVRVLESFV